MAHVAKYPVKRSPAEFDPKEQLDNNLCQKRAAYSRLGKDLGQAGVRTSTYLPSTGVARCSRTECFRQLGLTLRIVG